MENVKLMNMEKTVVTLRLNMVIIMTIIIYT